MRASSFRKFFFFFFVLAVSGYAFFEYYRSSQSEISIQKKSMLISDSLSDLQKISVIGKEKFTLSQESGEWNLIRPIQDRVDPNQLSSWFDQLRNQKISNIKLKKPTDWKSYYLDKPITIEWTLKSGKVQSLSVSYKNNFDGKYFIRKNDSLFLGTAFLSDVVVNKTKDDLRSKKILHSTGHPNEILFRGKTTLSLSWRDYKWQVQGDKGFPLNSSRLDGFWTDLASLKALKIIAPATLLNLKKYGLHKAPFQITLKFNEKALKIKMSSLDSKRVFILNLSRGYILEISKQDAQKLVLSRKSIRKKSPEPKSIKK